MEHRKHVNQEFSQKNSNPYYVHYENYLDTNACTECTGLMPNMPEGREEWDSYREIFDFIPKPPAPDQND